MDKLSANSLSPASGKKGEVVTTLTVISLLVMLAGLLVGGRTVQNTEQASSRAASRTYCGESCQYGYKEGDTKNEGGGKIRCVKKSSVCSSPSNSLVWWNDVGRDGYCEGQRPNYCIGSKKSYGESCASSGECDASQNLNCNATSDSCDFISGREPYSRTDKVACERVGGTWKQFATACADLCVHGNTCAQVLTWSCDCAGQNKCWNLTNSTCDNQPVTTQVSGAVNITANGSSYNEVNVCLREVDPSGRAGDCTQTLQLNSGGASRSDSPNLSYGPINLQVNKKYTVEAEVKANGQTIAQTDQPSTPNCARLSPFSDRCLLSPTSANPLTQNFNLSLPRASTPPAIRGSVSVTANGKAYEQVKVFLCEQTAAGVTTNCNNPDNLNRAGSRTTDDSFLFNFLNLTAGKNYILRAIVLDSQTTINNPLAQSNYRIDCPQARGQFDSECVVQPPAQPTFRISLAQQQQANKITVRGNLNYSGPVPPGKKVGLSLCQIDANNRYACNFPGGSKNVTLDPSVSSVSYEMTNIPIPTNDKIIVVLDDAGVDGVSFPNGTKVTALNCPLAGKVPDYDCVWEKASQYVTSGITQSYQIVFPQQPSACKLNIFTQISDDQKNLLDPSKFANPSKWSFVNNKDPNSKNPGRFGSDGKSPYQNIYEQFDKTGVGPYKVGDQISWTISYDDKEYQLVGNNVRVCDYDANKDINCKNRLTTDDNQGTGQTTASSPLDCNTKVVGGWWFKKIEKPIAKFGDVHVVVGGYALGREKYQNVSSCDYATVTEGVNRRAEKGFRDWEIFGGYYTLTLVGQDGKEYSGNASGGGWIWDFNKIPVGTYSLRVNDTSNKMRYVRLSSKCDQFVDNVVVPENPAYTQANFRGIGGFTNVAMVFIQDHNYSCSTETTCSNCKDSGGECGPVQMCCKPYTPDKGGGGGDCDSAKGMQCAGNIPASFGNPPSSYGDQYCKSKGYVKYVGWCEQGANYNPCCATSSYVNPTAEPGKGGGGGGDSGAGPRGDCPKGDRGQAGEKNCDNINKCDVAGGCNPSCGGLNEHRGSKIFDVPNGYCRTGYSARDVNQTKYQTCIDNKCTWQVCEAGRTCVSDCSRCTGGGGGGGGGTRPTPTLKPILYPQCDNAGGACEPNYLCTSENNRQNLGTKDCPYPSDSNPYRILTCCKRSDNPQSNACTNLPITDPVIRDARCGAGSCPTNMTPYGRNGCPDAKPICCVQRVAAPQAGTPTPTSATPQCRAANGYCTTSRVCSLDGGTATGRKDCNSGEICCTSPVISTAAPTRTPGSGETVNFTYNLDACIVPNSVFTLNVPGLGPITLVDPADVNEILGNVVDIKYCEQGTTNCTNVNSGIFRVDPFSSGQSMIRGRYVTSLKKGVTYSRRLTGKGVLSGYYAEMPPITLTADYTESIPPSSPYYPPKKCHDAAQALLDGASKNPNLICNTKPGGGECIALCTAIEALTGVTPSFCNAHAPVTKANVQVKLNGFAPSAATNWNTRIRVFDSGGKVIFQTEKTKTIGERDIVLPDVPVNQLQIDKYIIDAYMLDRSAGFVGILTNSCGSAGYCETKTFKNFVQFDILAQPGVGEIKYTYNIKLAYVPTNVFGFNVPGYGNLRLLDIDDLNQIVGNSVSVKFCEKGASAASCRSLALSGLFKTPTTDPKKTLIQGSYQVPLKKGITYTRTLEGRGIAADLTGPLPDLVIPVNSGDIEENVDYSNDVAVAAAALLEGLKNNPDFPCNKSSAPAICAQACSIKDQLDLDLWWCSRGTRATPTPTRSPIACGCTQDSPREPKYCNSSCGAKAGASCSTDADCQAAGGSGSITLSGNYTGHEDCPAETTLAKFDGKYSYPPGVGCKTSITKDNLTIGNHTYSAEYTDKTTGLLKKMCSGSVTASDFKVVYGGYTEAVINNCNYDLPGSAPTKAPTASPTTITLPACKPGAERSHDHQNAHECKVPDGSTAWECNDGYVMDTTVIPRTCKLAGGGGPSGTAKVWTDTDFDMPKSFLKGKGPFGTDAPARLVPNYVKISAFLCDPAVTLDNITTCPSKELGFTYVSETTDTAKYHLVGSFDDVAAKSYIAYTRVMKDDEELKKGKVDQFAVPPDKEITKDKIESLFAADQGFASALSITNNSTKVITSITISGCDGSGNCQEVTKSVNVPAGGKSSLKQLFDNLNNRELTILDELQFVCKLGFSDGSSVDCPKSQKPVAYDNQLAVNLNVSGNGAVTGTIKSEKDSVDFNKDGVVNITDLAFIFANYGKPVCDVDGDGKCNALDISIGYKWLQKSL